jgi:UDP:flavonoid glycosyltransferase YjiC (YdhE family)
MALGHPSRPLRVVLTTFGSLGDLHPYLAIGLELRSRGHDVVIATSNYYREKIEALGLGFHAVRPDSDVALRDPDTMRRVMDEKTGGEVVIAELVMPYLRETYADLTAACAGADVLVGHMLTYTARLVSEKTGIPWISSMLQPVGLFSACDPPVLPDAGYLRHFRWLGPGFHRAVFRIGRRMVRPWGEPWHRFRAEIGLPPTKDDPVFEGQHSPGLVLILFSPELAPPQPDWPRSAVICGFPFFDTDGAPGIAPALARFLDAGTPPIVFTLGSSAVHDPGTFYVTGAEVARRLGRRAVLLIGRDAAPPASLPDGVASFDYAPFSELFPRAAAIVHQGGVGTTAQAMRSGRPMLVMPYSHDQPDNAARVCRLGIARTLTRARFTPDRATREIRKLLDDPDYAARAAEVGARVRKENGARAAAEAIERLTRANRSPRAAPGGALRA